MQIKTQHVLLAGAAGLLLYSAYKARSVANLLFFPGNVLSLGFYGANPVMTFNLQIQNTSSLPVIVNALGGNLFSNDTLVGNVYSTQPIEVPANGRVYHTLEAQFLLVGIVNNLIDAWQYKNFTQKLQLQGYANVSGLQVPLDLEMSIGM